MRAPQPGDSLVAPPRDGASYTTDEAKAAALAAFTAAIARAREPTAQEESASVARAHATLAAEWARPGHDAHWLGDEFTFDEVRGCMRKLKNRNAAGGEGIPSQLSSIRVARECKC